jgi:hypothetical protein
MINAASEMEDGEEKEYLSTHRQPDEEVIHYMEQRQVGDE